MSLLTYELESRFTTGFQELYEIWFIRILEGLKIDMLYEILAMLVSCLTLLLYK